MTDSASSLLQELRMARTSLDQISESLQSQADLLRQRGIALPAATAQAISSLKADFVRLESQIVEAQTELGQLRALASMSARITTTLDVDTVLSETMDIVIALTRAERGYLILVNEAESTLEFRIIRDDSVNPLKGGGVPQVSQTVLREVMTTRQPLLADNAYKDERLQNNASVANFALRSVLCVPLLLRDKVIGVVYVDNRLQAGIFTEREKHTLVAFAATAAVAIGNAMLYADIQRLLSEITRVKALMDNVFESIGSGVIATDSQDIITTFNRAAAHILAQSGAESIGQPLRAILPHFSSGLADLLEAVRQSQRPAALEAELETLRGTVIVNLKLNPLRGSTDESQQGLALVMEDITRQRAREQQINMLKTYLPPAMVDNIQTISSLALGGERREVTCVFAEVRPFSTLDDVPPMQALSLIDHYLSVATACIHDTQGVIDKYMGTEVMALYNTQLSPQQNHAWLAIEAALLMRDAFARLYQEQGIDPQPHFYRIGLHSGVATLGNVGSLNRRNFTALGDTINLAKRLQENAQRGQIIISQESLELIEAAAPGHTLPYRFAELPPIQVKGRQQVTRIYEVFRQ